jgi:hypothetical protein
MPKSISPPNSGMFIIGRVRSIAIGSDGPCWLAKGDEIKDVPELVFFAYRLLFILHRPYLFTLFVSIFFSRTISLLSLALEADS